MENNEIKNKILERTRLNIAMSEFGKEYKMKNNKKKDKKKDKYFYIRRIVAAVVTICLITVGGTQAKNLMVEYENRNATYIVESISDAIENGYVENLNMDYIYSDGVGFKVDSLIMSDSDIDIQFNFDISDEVNLDVPYMQYAYILYNENNEIYYIGGSYNNNFLLKFRWEKGIKLVNGEIPTYWSSSHSQYLTYTKNNVVVNESITAKDSFPKAKRLFVRVYGIGYEDDETSKYKKITDSVWDVEIDIPEKFYSATRIEYEFAEDVSGVNLQQCFVTDTSMVFSAYIKGINGKKIPVLVDEDGNEYASSNGCYYYGTDGNIISEKFPITKSKLPEKMYIKAEVDGEEKVMELIQKQ